jgi:hypothetical protein
MERFCEEVKPMEPHGIYTLLHALLIAVFG